MRNGGKEKKDKREERSSPLTFRVQRANLDFVQCDSRKGVWGIPPQRKDRDKSTQLELLRLNMYLCTYVHTYLRGGTRERL